MLFRTKLMAYANNGIGSFYLHACTRAHTDTQMILHTFRDSHPPMYCKM